MSANLIDLRQAGAAAGGLPGLQERLAPLVGEPFRFARVGYGEELTLHFGDLRPARSPKLAHRQYGAYVLGTRASHWTLKSGTEPLVLAAAGPDGVGTPVRKEDVEAAPLIAPESRVLSAAAFLVKPLDGYGLQVRTSDGSSLLIVPAPAGPDEAADESLPEVADWELASPEGLLAVGPGPAWTFKARDWAG